MTMTATGTRKNAVDHDDELKMIGLRVGSKNLGRWKRVTRSVAPKASGTRGKILGRRRAR